MMSVSTSEESERRLAEAMRAHAAGVGRPGFASRQTGFTGHPVPARPVATAAAERPAVPSGSLRGALSASRTALLLLLIGGVVLGVTLAALSLLAPGVLPALG